MYTGDEVIDVVIVVDMAAWQLQVVQVAFPEVFIADGTNGLADTIT